MDSIQLGTSTLKVSRLAYGCWRIVGRSENPELTPENEAEARKAILTAFDCGFTLFDHADVYANGLAEEVFGKVLRENPGMRDKIVIGTKCGVRRQGKPNPTDPYRYDFSPEHITRSCEDSLRRLGIDTIDLYQLHRPDYLANPEEVAAVFSKLNQQGKVREFGLSNASPSFFALMQKYSSRRLIVNQVEISLMRLEPFSDGTLDQCQAEKITPLAWSPLAGGRLLFIGPIDLNEAGHARRLMLRETMDRLAHERGVSRGVIGIAWLLRHPAGIVPIIGTATPKNIKDLAQAVNLNLSREEWYTLMEAANGHRLP
jgi:predicted oxidoreductase